MTVFDLGDAAADDRRTERTCPKCATAMVSGFMVDYTYGNIAPPEWAEGERKVSFWTGQLKNETVRYAVETFRCPQCGFLESYTRHMK